jgi:ribonuclease HII
MRKNNLSAEIIDDSSDEKQEEDKEEEEEEFIMIPKQTKVKKTRIKKPVTLLKKCRNIDEKIIEIGVDEAGRGPLFGRVYTAAVILPKDDSFDLTMVKDSKKFHSKKRIEESAEYIRANSIAWHVSFEDERKIDEINILQATQLSMHNSINSVIKSFNLEMKNLNKKVKVDYDFSLLIDGNYFNPITYFNKATDKIETLPYMTVESGDNTYASIAAASILAKVARDQYIDELCAENHELGEHYGIDSNKGYGAKKHMDGIKEHGITMWHRRSFAPCKNYV